MNLSPAQRDLLATLAMWDMRATMDGYTYGETRVTDRESADALHRLGLLEWTGEGTWARITPAGRKIRSQRNG